MTAPTPTSDAVQIVAKALTIALATSDTPYEDVVAALAAADLLARPGELAALRAVAEAIGELFILDVGRSTQGRAWVKVDQEGFDRLRTALDAVPAAETGSSGEAPGAVAIDSAVGVLRVYGDRDDSDVRDVADWLERLAKTR